jgi:type II secretory pathway pseudopilin PulG
MARRPLGRRGSTLLETLLAVCIMTVAGLSIVAMLQKSLVANLKARERVSCERAAQSGLARLKNVNFYRLYAVDSATTAANYGLWGGYPHLAALNGIAATLNSARFDRYKVDVTFMRRDASDALGTGNTNDLIAFTDADQDGVDDYDPAIRYFDQNGDGDMFDTYVAGGRTIAEQPDTHLKHVTFRVYRRGREVCAKSELISLEQFTGITNPDSGSALTLEISTPSNNAYAYSAQSAGLAASRALAVFSAYPADVVQLRADAASPLAVSGKSEPLASVGLYVGASPELASVPVDAFGDFSGAPAAVTAALLEGQNTLRGRASKAAFSSPWGERELIYDLRAPGVTGGTPTGAVPAPSPYVSAVISDTTTLAGAVASGICPQVTGMKVNGSTVAFAYDAATGRVRWVDAATQAPPALADGVYNVVVEAGDYAGYKSTAGWSFTVAVPATDNSDPSFSLNSPIGMAGSDLPVISVKIQDNQSGIVLSSIVMRLDGVVVVDPSNIGQHWDPATDTLSYTPSAPFASGSGHTVQVTASHGATDPPDKVTDTDTWGFVVP